MELIFDRTQEDVINNTEKGSYNCDDLNRVAKACYELEELLKSVGYSVEFELKTDWTMYDYPTVEKMERYIKNLLSIADNYFRYSGTPHIPGTMENLTIEGANDIEKALYDIKCLTDATKTNQIYSGMHWGGNNTNLLRGNL